MERFTINELAEILGVDRREVGRRIRKDGIPFVYEGRNTYVEFRDVAHWINDDRTFNHAGTDAYQNRRRLQCIFDTLALEDLDEAA